ncbi:glycosyltransferase [Desulfosporosinus sp. PR]|uniref:glycosyltransferase family 2 protein n=1 Tax=Candidatus Desulfosporosinus nitrosoreducens TaxID=3401928 RepID=UPI0027FDA3EF|nr:glycosyltransferase [Desulfosporosinus sp. PR]MDQ7092671.1 glycosyltransferase [Desulfosporosinus sp. PR]
MKDYRIVCICQIYNELCKGNLQRFVSNILPVVSDLVVYDDGSTDGSYEYMLKQTPYVIRATKNDFVNERSHKQLLLQEALKLQPDFILWLDADEVLTANAAEKLQELCAHCDENQIDAVNMHEINLWRSNSWRRMDSLYDSGWFCRLWRVVPGICFHETKPGLHQPLFPSTIRTVKWTLDVQVLHYGFSSQQRLAYKYLVYKSHGQRGYDMLDRLISEEKLVTEKVPRELFPEGLWVDDEAPQAMTFAESLAYVEEYRAEVFKPRFSIICLVYKSVEWLKFVYEQVFKYTDMSDKEFFFVANDANSAVLKYLEDNYIPHYVFENTPEQQKEWYVNNVYRAYNFAVSKAQGDFVVLINTDMAFSPGWFDSLWQAYNGENCVASRLVESGKLRSGQYGVEKDFGRDYASYQEREFQRFARDLSEQKLLDGGLFMPILIRKEHFEKVGGYPEGQVLLGSDLYRPVIAKRGETCISGDTVLSMKLQAMGIKHQTAFDSLVYHFQWGELDSLASIEGGQGKIKIALCHDSNLDSSSEQEFWRFLQESLPASVLINKQLIGDQGDYAVNVQTYIRDHYPDVEIIVQDALSNCRIDTSRYTIGVLQDNLQSSGMQNANTEINLVRADKFVANSAQTVLDYPEHDFEIIPRSTQDSKQKWQYLLKDIHKKLMIEKANRKKVFEQHKVSIIITTFQRTHLLRWGLYSLSLKEIPYEFETIVLNDGIEDETEEICNEFKEKLNLKYIFTGQRNLNGHSVWRVPGFAINIGAKQSSGDILVFSCAEMFHVNQTIASLTKAITDNPKLLGIPIGKDDREGVFLEYLTENAGKFDLETYNKCINLDTRMPFLMALHRSQFMEIGGYDEDFVGIAYDDRDLIDRLLKNGCQYCHTDAITVHLYHPRAKGYYEGGGPPEWDYNKNLYFSRIGKIVRNEGKEWGKL